MQLPCFLSRTLAFSSILFATFSPLASPARAGEREEARALVDDIVQLVDNHYLNGDATSSEWEEQRQALLSHTYDGEAEARTDVVRALEHLNDPYTYLLSPDEFESVQDGVRGKVADIGIRLRMGAQGLPTVSAQPMMGSPAFLAGILPGDVIVAVDGRNSEGWSPGETLRHIQGQEDSAVQLTLLRDGEHLELELSRANLSRPSVSYIIESYTDSRHMEQQVAYIQLARFDERSIGDMRKAIAELESQGVDGYVLDLRSNPGGLLQAGTAIAEMFLDGGTIVTVQDRDRVRRIVDRQAPLTDKPLAVLVDGGSASSSEVLAGALRDADRATLVGTQTFGKGVVQTLYMLADGSCLAITTASYRTPDGHDLHLNGLRPDVYVEIGLEERSSMPEWEPVMLSVDDSQYRAAVDSLFNPSNLSDGIVTRPSDPVDMVALD